MVAEEQAKWLKKIAKKFFDQVQQYCWLLFQTEDGSYATERPSSLTPLLFSVVAIKWNGQQEMSGISV